MAFNQQKGSFVEEKQVSGKFKLQFNPNSKILDLKIYICQSSSQPF